MRTILVVTDNTGTMTSVSRMLMNRGYSVIPTYGAAAALSAVRSGAEIDAVIADYALSGIDIYGFFAALKKAFSLQLPVILMDDRVDIETYLNALSLGAVDFLFKPIEPGELFRVLKVAAGNQGANTQGPADRTSYTAEMLRGRPSAERQSAAAFQ